ncbi:MULTISPECIES: YqzH family protein [Bacillus]|jgi:hypothetical protein|uniref:YqzH-like protein n=1 Tax=Bacillus smithii 7_3_47FAA TaxID=665952 RepID=G9QPF3_9BACI|nr:YqzH family protein [Bacillus smithii]AKP47682.1 hypothetical protein BSM4216_2444 [Bacillus smithii]EHL73815.1 hypothetical protein HMPREF1015_00170 [Bacillus smithii 7_3_47FAA]MED0658584.1 YqzH family protein [Bacillus smithii]MED1418951.1 YqzH family protein [Bacillus smithii]MED1455207.1 YqzH family protein [Bacillus smithii]
MEKMIILMIQKKLQQYKSPELTDKELKDLAKEVMIRQKSEKGELHEITEDVVYEYITK